MGCTGSYDPLNYEENQKEDYLTKTIFESIMARRRAKIQGEYDAERKEQEDREKELMRQQYLLNSINPRGPKSYVDNLINKEIPKMEFGNLASEEQLLDDLNDRECEEYGEDEKEEETEEEMTESEIKDKQAQNKNEMEELKKKLEELNKKSEEDKNKNIRKKKDKDDFFGKKDDNKENEEEKKEESKNEEEEEKEKKKKKKDGEESNEEEEENESKIKDKSQKDKKGQKNEKSDEDKNEEEEEEDDDVEEGENKKRKKKNKQKGQKNENGEIDSKNEKNQEENEIGEESENKNLEEEEEEDREEKEKIKRKERLEKKRTMRQIKLKQLMKLKAENPFYADKIKKYKYPKKEIEEKPKAEFSPTPSEIIICVIGEEKNGKTSFIKKYTRNVFEEIYKKTENIDTYDEVEANYDDDKNIKLIILDTPPLNDRKNIQLIQENGINKSHIILYIVDINDEYADFKVKLTLQNYEFSQKQIVAIIGNKSDKVSIFSKKNKDTLGGFCSLKKFFFEILSCQDTPQNEIENFVNEKIINEYFKLYNA